MNDLLSRSFKQRRQSGDARQGDLESGNLKKLPPNVQLANLSSDGESMGISRGLVEGEVKKVKQLLLQLQRAKKESKPAIRAEAVKAVRAQIDAGIAFVTKSAMLINEKLKAPDESNGAHHQLPGSGAGSPQGDSDRESAQAARGAHKRLPGPAWTCTRKQSSAGPCTDSLLQRTFSSSNSKP
jgi:hypothetical protein